MDKITTPWLAFDRLFDTWNSNPGSPVICDTFICSCWSVPKGSEIQVTAYKKNPKRKDAVKVWVTSRNHGIWDWSTGKNHSVKNLWHGAQNLLSRLFPCEAKGYCILPVWVLVHYRKAEKIKGTD